MGWIEYRIISIEIVFRRNLISERSTPEFVEIYLLSRLCTFPINMKFCTPNVSLYVPLRFYFGSI